MLGIQFSNRIETLCDAVVDALGAVPASPFTTQQIVVPSSAMRRHLTLSIAERHGICANVEGVYLAQWLWTQIAKVVSGIDTESPFAASALEWRVYQMLQDTSWSAYPRLANYLKDPSAVMRFELAAEIAALFEQYITYRQDWLSAWLTGAPVRMPKANTAQLDDQAWQAELWRRISGDLGAAPEHPASVFLKRLASAGTTRPNAPGAANAAASASATATASVPGSPPFGLPQTVHVFCLPAMPPLYLDVLTGLARWVDVTLYVLNPCREYWFDIVDPKRLHSLALRGAATYHDTGNRLLASWGKQTKAHVELLLERASDAPLDDSGFGDDADFAATTLGRLQHAIFTLTELQPGSLASDAQDGDRSIEVHVCHSLTRQLEVLQDQLLALFAGPAPPRPEQILIVTPDLETAAPLIDAVFGNVPDERRLPYAITGRGRTTVNGAARALLALLAILPSRFPASALVELLQQPLIGRRFDIAAEELQVIEEWLHASGIRWGLDADHRHDLAVPGTDRFTIADGLDRLFLGYALPQQVAEPVFGRIPAGNAEGSQADILGSFAEFVERLTALRAELDGPRLPDAWLDALLEILDTFLAPASYPAPTDDLEDFAEVRATLRELHANMLRGGLTTPVPLAVLRASLQSLFDDGARGGVPTGSITFSALSSLRNLPFKFIGIVGLEDGAFPAAARPREFDLMAAEPRAGDRQRRLDDRNLFLDLLLAARERLYLSYTGRSIRDNSVRPPSAVVAELIETLLPALAPADATGNGTALAAARHRLIIEHPLQAFDAGYFRDSDPRRRSYNRELCDALRHALAAALTATTPDAAATDTAWSDGAWPDADRADPSDSDDDALTDRALPCFFSTPLAPPGTEWRRVTLDQLQRFFRNPAAFLLKERLGMSLYREEDGVSDEEPFLPDWPSRQALAERLLPQAMQGLGAPELSRLARAGIEYPPGAVGAVALRDEMASLQRFAAAVQVATQAPRLPPLTVELPFVLAGEDWQLTTVLTERRASGLALHRYDDTRSTDYLTAWLTHLVAAAAAPTTTHWISRDGSFRFLECRDAHAILERIVALYRQGLSQPLHFFPKTAWEYIRNGRVLTKAAQIWHKTYGSGKGEEEHPAYKLALRGVEPLDAGFTAAAEIVFGSAVDYLDDPRP